MTSTKNKKNEPIRVLFVFSGNNQHERDPTITISFMPITASAAGSP